MPGIYATQKCTLLRQPYHQQHKGNATKNQNTYQHISVISCSIRRYCIARWRILADPSASPSARICGARASRYLMQSASGNVRSTADEQSYILRQVENGMAVRKSLLWLLCD